MSISINGTNGLTFNDGSSQQTAATGFGFKSRIINGAMVNDQRNAGAAQTINNTTAYTVDRWYVNFSGGAGTSQRVAGTGGYQYALRLTGGAGVTSGFFGQKIESYNIADLASSTVTYKIRLSSSVLTSLTWYARYPNSQDNYSGVTVINSGTLTITSTPTDYTFQIALPSGVANGLEVFFLYGAFTSGTLDITGVQLEKGSTATSFDYRPYGTELALCWRYYQRHYDFKGTGALSGAGTSAFRCGSLLPVQMRASPTVGLIGTIGFFDGSNAATATSFSTTYSTISSIEFDAVLSATLKANGVATTYTGGGFSVTASAEL